MTRCAFINADGIVVNVISGALSPIEQQRFLADYAVLFGATSCEIVASEVPVWIGGTYTTEAGFSPPPSTEPEPIVEEPTNDAA